MKTTVKTISLKMLIVFSVAAMMLAVGAAGAIAAFDNPAYTYTKILDVGEWVRTSESQFSYDGSKILWNERTVDPAIGKNVQYAVKYGDWNSVTKTISNVTTVASMSDPLGVNGVVAYAKWSPDDSYIAYGSGSSTENAIKRYKLSDKSVNTMYTPGTGVDWGNFDFYGNNNSLVFWDSSTGGADLFTYDGTTRSQLTTTSTLKEYEPRVLGSDASKVLYWSGETTGEPYDSIHILNSDASVTNVALGTSGHDLYWPVWGKDQSYVGVVDAGAAYATDLLLYKNVGGTWTLAEDLLGPGYTPAAGDNNYFGSFLANGSFCFSSQVGNIGRDIWFAEVPEPGTLVLLSLAGLSGLAMVWIRRRRLSG
jgi:hypothetical protein